MKVVQLKLGNQKIYPMLLPSQTSTNASGGLSKEDIWNYIEEYFDERRSPQINSSVSSTYIKYGEDSISVMSFAIHSNNYCNEPTYIKVYTTNGTRVKIDMSDNVYGINDDITLENDPIIIGEYESYLKDNILQFIIYPNIVSDVVIRVEIVGKTSNKIFDSSEQKIRIGYFGEDFEDEYLFKKFDSSNTSSEILEQYADYIERMNSFVDLYNEMNCFMGRGAFTKFRETYTYAYLAFNSCYKYVLNNNTSEMTSKNLDNLETQMNSFIEKSQEKLSELMELWENDSERLNNLLNAVEEYDHNLTDEQRQQKESVLNEIYKDIDDMTDTLNSVIHNENPKLTINYTFEYTSHQDEIATIEQKFEAIN